MMYDILALFVFVTLMVCIAFDFSMHYAEKERQERYNKMVKYRRKPLIIDEEALKRIGRFVDEWERQKGN